MIKGPRAIPRIVVFTLSILALASCGAPKDAERQAAGEVETSEPAPRVPRATSTPKSAALPSAPAQAVLTPEGFGPLRIGMTLAEVTAALGSDGEPGRAGGLDPQSCDQFRPARAPRGVLVMIEEGVLSRISLIDPSAVKTERGVGVGSTADAVKTAYKNAVATPHKYRDAPSQYLTDWTRKAVRGDQTSPTDRGIVFEINEKRVVEAVHAGGPSIQYVEGCS